MMRFNNAVGNPPYTLGNRTQVYADFYLLSRRIAERVSLIFPSGWQGPKNANGLKKLNNKAIKRDKQIVSIENLTDVFSEAKGAAKTNIIFWKKGYDNGLSGKQRIINEGIKQLPIQQSDIEKPLYIRKLYEYVSSAEGFTTIYDEVSARKPYGFGTNIISAYKPYGSRPDILTNHEKYELPPLNNSRKHTSDIRVFTTKGMKYVDREYPFPKIGEAFTSYKVFVPKAWGNWREQAGLGGAYADIYVAQPGDTCTESYLECGAFDNETHAVYMAKYLMTQFTRALIYKNKYSQNSARSIYRDVPKQDFSETWWGLSVEEINARLYEKYNVPRDVRMKVDENVQKKSDKNIIIL